MGEKLAALFDFQRFDGNPKLQRVIDDVHARYAARELDLDEIELVSAAGSTNRVPEKKDPEKGRL